MDEQIQRDLKAFHLLVEADAFEVNPCTAIQNLEELLAEEKEVRRTGKEVSKKTDKVSKRKSSREQSGSRDRDRRRGSRGRELCRPGPHGSGRVPWQ